MTVVDLFWLAPLVPLGASTVLVIGVPGCRRVASGIAIAGVGASAALSFPSLIAAARGVRPGVSATWMDVGGRPFELALTLDPLGAVAATLVSVIAVVVFVYAAAYMAEDQRASRFFALMNLFIAAMLALVLAADLMMLFIAWELVGLCSALLIGFWFERAGAGAAATKGFLVTRLGDLALLLGLLLFKLTIGSSRIDAVLSAVLGGEMSSRLLVGIGLLLFVAAATKSAQVPFQGWLPDAMVGPTPVSALLHSATMVAAGVFLIARLYPLFEAAPALLAVIAWTGGVTAVVGGAAALVESDLKRALAYSTMSQLGLMFVGLGAGSLLAGVLLLIGQAFYKALLFLAAGVIDRAVGGTEFARMGGLARRLTWTFVAVAIGGAALAGLPATLAVPLKDHVLAAAWMMNGWLFWTVVAASLLTALYSARIVTLIFFGRPCTDARRQPHEPRGLLVSVLVLAAMTPVALLADAQILGHPLQRLLARPPVEVAGITVTSVAVAALGVGAGLWARHRWPAAVVWPPLRPAASLVMAEFGLKPLYTRATAVALAVVRWTASADHRVFDPIAATAAGAALAILRAVGQLDRSLFDTLASKATNAVLAIVGAASHFDRFFDALATQATHAMLRVIRAGARFDARGVDALITRLAAGVLAVSGRLRVLQNGRIENYLVPIFVWAFVLVALAAFAARIT